MAAPSLGYSGVRKRQCHPSVHPAAELELEAVPAAAAAHRTAQLAAVKVAGRWMRENLLRAYAMSVDFQGNCFTANSM